MIKKSPCININIVLCYSYYDVCEKKLFFQIELTNREIANFLLKHVNVI